MILSCLVSIIAIFLLGAANANERDGQDRRLYSPFQVIAWVPISKTLVTGTPGRRPIYTYAYRISVLNKGPSATDVIATISSDRRSVIVDDPVLSFGSIPVLQTKTSSDTVTVRAGRFFDRRLDKTTIRNGRLDYSDAGNDDDDNDLPNFEVHFPYWTKTLVDAWYLRKFNHVFDLKFQQRPDTSGPLISNATPQGTVASAKPTISANYTDSSGVSTRTLSLKVDGVDVTSQASISIGTISYTPVNALTQGLHTVMLTLRDAASNSSVQTWSFTVSSVLLEVINQFPAPFSRIAGVPRLVLRGQVVAQGQAIDTSRTRISIDGIDITNSLVWSGSSFAYVYTDPIPDGLHRVSVQIYIEGAVVTTRDWEFEVFTPAALVNPTPLDTFTLDRRPLMIVQLSGFPVAARTLQVSVNGQDLSAVSSFQDDRLEIRPTTDLAIGEQVVQATVSSAGAVVSKTWRFSIIEIPRASSDSRTLGIEPLPPGRAKIPTVPL